jgi:Uma2 family endonuclease
MPDSLATIMTNFAPVPQTISTDTWVEATWEDFLTYADDPTLISGRFYYDSGWMRLEMSPFGSAHGRRNTIISTLINLYATLKGISLTSFTNTTFRKVGVREAQPDLAFYLGTGYNLPPDNNSPVNLNKVDPPTLVVEIAASSLEDDLTRKVTLYQRLGVQEYWVIDVNQNQVIAKALTSSTTTELSASQVLLGLELKIVESALQRSQQQDDSGITRWLLGMWQERD